MNKKIGAWLAAIATAVLVLVSVAPQAGLAVYEEAPVQIQPRLAPVEAPAGNDGGPGGTGGGGSGSGQDGLGPSQLGPGNVGPGEVRPGEPPGADKSRPSWSDWWKDKVDWLKQKVEDLGTGIVDGAKSAWDKVSTAAVNAWDGVSNWAVDTWNGFSPQVRGALKGLVGGLIAVAVVALVVVVFSLGGWIVVVAMVVAVAASVAYGWMAGDNASILTGAVVGTLAGLATLVGGKFWLAGLRQMTLQKLLMEGVIGGFISAVATAVADGIEIAFLGRDEPFNVADVGVAFIKGFIGAILFAPLIEGIGLSQVWPRYVKRGLKRGDPYWKQYVWLKKAGGVVRRFVTAGAFGSTSKAILDTLKDPAHPPSITQILGVGFVVAMFSFLNLKFIKQEMLKDTTEELVGEGAERVTDTVIDRLTGEQPRQEIPDSNTAPDETPEPVPQPTAGQSGRSGPSTPRLTN